MSAFTTEIYIYTPDGEEHEIPVTVDYSATHDNGDAWTPPYGEMTLNIINPVGSLPDGVTMQMLLAKAIEDEEKIEDEAWEHYFRKGVDDED